MRARVQGRASLSFVKSRLERVVGAGDGEGVRGGKGREMASKPWLLERLNKGVTKHASPHLGWVYACMAHRVYQVIATWL